MQRFLRELLKDGKPVAKKTIDEQANERGFTKKQLRTAYEKLGIQAEKLGMDGGWSWKLPSRPVAQAPRGQLRQGPTRTLNKKKP